MRSKKQAILLTKIHLIRHPLLPLPSEFNRAKKWWSIAESNR